MYRGGFESVASFMHALPANPPPVLLNLPFTSLAELFSYITLDSYYLKFIASSEIIGLHLKSHLLSLIAPLHTYFKNEGIQQLIGYSAHSASEVEDALAAGADYCTLSPIYATPHKGVPLGMEYLSCISEFTRLHIIALGGIKSHHLPKLEELGILGFAGISYFKENKE